MAPAGVEYRPMRMIRAILFIAFAVCTAGRGAFGADTIAKNESELKAIENEINALRSKIQSDERMLKNERATLQQTEKELISLNNELAQTQSEIEQARELGRSLKSEADAERARIAETLGKLGDIVVSQHAMGDQGFLKLLLSQEDPGAVERTLIYYRYLANMTADRVADSRVQVEQLVQIENKHTAQQDLLNELLESQKNQQLALENMRKKRELEIAGLDRQLTKSANRIGRLEEDHRRIRNLVNGLQEAAKNRQLAQAKARAKAQQKLADTQKKQTAADNRNTVTQTVAVVQRVSNDGLGKLKGRLNMPVAGKINAVYGSAKAGSGIKWNGIMLAARDGEPVRAIYDGQIVYADWFKGFGQLIIVDHGQGYMSLYSHNSRLTRKLGEHIKANDIIAYAGATGGLSEPGLYFEVRYNGEPRDPLLWVKR